MECRCLTQVYNICLSLVTLVRLDQPVLVGIIENLANDTLAMSNIENKELTLHTYHYIQSSSGTFILC